MGGQDLGGRAPPVLKRNYTAQQYAKARKKTMKERIPTNTEIARFEKLAALPTTPEVMDELGKRLAFNFERPARAFIEIAANRLGLDYSLMDMFHTWWTFDRVKAA